MDYPLLGSMTLPLGTSGSLEVSSVLMMLSETGGGRVRVEGQ